MGHDGTYNGGGLVLKGIVETVDDIQLECVALSNNVSKVMRTRRRRHSYFVGLDDCTIHDTVDYSGGSEQNVRQTNRRGVGSLPCKSVKIDVGIGDGKVGHRANSTENSLEQKPKDCGDGQRERCH